MIVPAAAAARAIPGSPSGCAMRCSAVGATSTGVATSVPSTVVAVVTSLDVDEHARAQAPARPGGDVLAQRVLVAGAARVVAERARRRARSAASRS